MTTEGERICLLEEHVKKANEDLNELKNDVRESLREIKNDVKELKNIIIEQNNNINTEMNKRPTMSSWLFLILFFFTLVSGSFTYTYMQTNKLDEKISYIESKRVNGEQIYNELSQDIVNRLNTIDRLLFVTKTSNDEKKD